MFLKNYALHVLIIVCFLFFLFFFYAIVEIEHIYIIFFYCILVPYAIIRVSYAIVEIEHICTIFFYCILVPVFGILIYIVFTQLFLIFYSFWFIFQGIKPNEIECKKLRIMFLFVFTIFFFSFGFVYVRFIHILLTILGFIYTDQFCFFIYIIFIYFYVLLILDYYSISNFIIEDVFLNRAFRIRIFLIGCIMISFILAYCIFIRVVLCPGVVRSIYNFYYSCMDLFEYVSDIQGVFFDFFSLFSDFISYFSIPFVSIFYIYYIVDLICFFFLIAYYYIKDKLRRYKIIRYLTIFLLSIIYLSIVVWILYSVETFIKTYSAYFWWWWIREISTVIVGFLFLVFLIFLFLLLFSQKIIFIFKLNDNFDWKYEFTSTYFFRLYFFFYFSFFFFITYIYVICIYCVIDFFAAKLWFTMPVYYPFSSCFYYRNYIHTAEFLLNIHREHMHSYRIFRSYVNDMFILFKDQIPNDPTPREYSESFCNSSILDELLYQIVADYSRHTAWNHVKYFYSWNRAGRGLDCLGGGFAYTNVALPSIAEAGCEDWDPIIHELNPYPQKFLQLLIQNVSEFYYRRELYIQHIEQEFRNKVKIKRPKFNRLYNPVN